MKLKLKASMKILTAIKKCLILVIMWISENNSNKLVIAKIKNEPEVLELKISLIEDEMYFLLVGNGEHKKEKDLNKNIYL